MDWTPVAELFRDVPELSLVIGTFVAPYLVQVWKRWRRLVPAGNATEKRIAAAVGAITTAAAYSYLAGGVDLPRLISAALLAWFASTGYHRVVLQSNGLQHN